MYVKEKAFGYIFSNVIGRRPTDDEVKNFSLQVAKKYKIDHDSIEATGVTEVKVGKFVKGEYYAHEYDEYADGKARLIKYKDVGVVELEVKCLDPKLRVLDGVWEYEGVGRQGNGCGDYFEAYERLV